MAAERSIPTGLRPRSASKASVTPAQISHPHADAESAVREPPLGKLHAAGTETIRRRQPEKLPLV